MKQLDKCVTASYFFNLITNNKWPQFNNSASFSMLIYILHSKANLSESVKCPPKEIDISNNTCKLTGEFGKLDLIMRFKKIFLVSETGSQQYSLAWTPYIE